MKKTEIKRKASKLQLHRETLRALEPGLLKDVAGGAETGNSQGSCVPLVCQKV